MIHDIPWKAKPSISNCRVQTLDTTSYFRFTETLHIHQKSLMVLTLVLVCSQRILFSLRPTGYMAASTRNINAESVEDSSILPGYFNWLFLLKSSADCIHVVWKHGTLSTIFVTNAPTEKDKRMYFELAILRYFVKKPARRPRKFILFSEL